MVVVVAGGSVTVILKANNWKYPNADTKDRVSKFWHLSASRKEVRECAVFRFLQREKWGPV